MPTLPLYDANPIARAWHRVRAPGGYEGWLFDAEDPAADTQIIARFFEGFVFHPGYLRAYRRYVRRPTRTQPPVAAEFSCVELAVYRNGRVVGQCLTQYPAGQFRAAADRVAVEIGPSSITSEDGTLRLHLEGSPLQWTWHGPQTDAARTLSADLSFAPRLTQPADDRLWLSRDINDAEHRWVPADPLCDVRGTIRLGDERIDFVGRGYHDHHYGTAPIDPGLRRWVRGRVLTESAAYAFHYAQPRARSQPPEQHVLRATTAGCESIDRPIIARWTRRLPIGLAYPAMLSVGDGLQLDQPRIIDAGPFSLRVQYRAKVDSADARALCEVAYPHRLRWPVVGRMVERSIDKRLPAGPAR